MNIIVVHDDIFIDLISVEPLDDLLRLPAEIHTTDMIINRIKGEYKCGNLLKMIKMGAVKVAEFSYEDVITIAKLKKFLGSANFSIQDCSLLYYAGRNGYAILSEDISLKNVSKQRGIEVHGIFYVFDKLVEYAIITKESAAEKLSALKMLNPRLSSNEIECRILEWCEGGSLKKEGTMDK